RRLNFFRPENIQGKLVRGVVASLEQIARQRLLKALEFNGITSEMIDPWECNIFFERAATLE
ncbi:MAG TPA: hypothetical protein VFW37_01125, partial [Alphaproteobacteria bacterium]|nr:hypothetical protein [Alphaproteobacteria bacterium]